MLRITGLLLLPLLLSGSQTAEQAVSFDEAERRRILQHLLPPLPADSTNRFADDPAAAHLGQFLFFDKRLSSTGDVSCATCHDPKFSFTDGAQLGRGIGPMNRHTQSLWNVAYNRWFFWDGRSDSLWSQALEPMEHELELGSSRTRIARLISSDDKLRQAYENVFGKLPDLSDQQRFPEDARPVNGAQDHPHHKAWNAMADADREAVTRVLVNVGKAIAAYERKLISRESSFDRFAAGLRDGDAAAMTALSPAAQRGLKLFIGDANCRLCHAGPNFTDGEFHNNGVPPLAGYDPDSGRHAGIARIMESPFRSTEAFSDAPEAASTEHVRFLIRTPESWGQLKTPSLRNVSQTAPYMHQGQFRTLEEVLHFYSTLEGAVIMGHHQETILQPLRLTQQQIEDLIAFLRSLNGEELDEKLLRQPDNPNFQP